MELHQITMHNRKDYQARLYQTSVRVMNESGGTLAAFTVRAARNAYIWSMREPVRDAMRIEVRTHKPPPAASVFLRLSVIASVPNALSPLP